MSDPSPTMATAASSSKAKKKGLLGRLKRKKKEKNGRGGETPAAPAPMSLLVPSLDSLELPGGKQDADATSSSSDGEGEKVSRSSKGQKKKDKKKKQQQKSGASPDGGDGEGRQRSSSMSLFRMSSAKLRGKSGEAQSSSTTSLAIGAPESFRHSLHVDEDLTWHSGSDAAVDLAVSDSMAELGALAAVPHAVDYFQFVLPEIGRGAFGTVYRALHAPSGTWMAVKVIHLGESLADEKNSMRRAVLQQQQDQLMLEIENEMDLLKLCSHPNVVQYYGNLRPAKNALCLLMAYAELGSMADVRSHFELSEPQIGWVLYCILRGLSYLADKAICHFDIKAANFLLNRDGVVQLADFGLAQKMGSQQRGVAGTRYWMAPELLRRASIHKAGFASDIWSLGITAIELAVGEPPYFDLDPMSAQRKILNDAPPVLPGGRWSASFKTFVSSCLRAEPSQRPGSTALLQHPFVAKHSSSSAKNKNRFAEIIAWSRKRSEARRDQSDHCMATWAEIEARRIRQRPRPSYSDEVDPATDQAHETTALLPVHQSPPDPDCCTACLIL